MEKLNDYFLSDSRKECYELIGKYIKDNVSLICLTGESGAGKTRFIKHLDKFVQGIKLIVVDHFCENSETFLRSVLKQMGVAPDGNKFDMLKAIAQYGADLLADGQKLIVAIDDISGVTEDIVGDISKLFDFEYNENKVVSIIFVTNNIDFPLLREWSTNYFKYNNQAIAYLNPFSKLETIEYFRYVCQINNLDISDFGVDEYTIVYKYTEGIPDRIAKIAELLNSFGIRGKITIKDVHSIIKSASIIKENKSKKNTIKPYVMAVMLIVVFAGITVMLLSNKEAKRVSELSIIQENKTEPEKQIAKPIQQSEPIKEEKVVKVEDKADKKECVTLKANLKLRKTPDINAPFDIVIPKGTKLIIISRESDWVKVSYKNKTGWIKASVDLCVVSECDK
ncbi:MAG: ATP-binding protein [Calditerrivibrio sp.]|nr:ATP-binding protein [Calditerrivibrio sp.]